MANSALPTQGVKELTQAVAVLTNQLKRAGVAAAATGAIFGGLMTRTAELFNPSEALRFQYRLRDLGAVIGSVLSPSFQRLSDTVSSLADWMYNLDEGTKKTINTFVSWGVPIAAATLALSGLAATFSHLGVMVKAFWGLASMSLSGFGSLLGLGKGAGKTAASSLVPTPVFIVGAAPGALGMGMGAAPGGTPTLIGPTSKKGGMSTGMKVLGGLAVGGGIAGAAVAGGHSMGEDLMMAGSAALGGMMAGGPLLAVIAGGLTLLTSQLKGWILGTGAGKEGPMKSSQGLAPRDVQSFSSVLDPGRKLRMNSLTTAGLSKADDSTYQQKALANFEAMNAAQQRMLNIWLNLGKVMEQQAQNNIAR